MARALGVFQEAYTVRICAKSNTVEKHSASEVPSAHVWALLISLQLLLQYKHAFCSFWCLLMWYHDFCLCCCAADICRHTFGWGYLRAWVTELGPLRSWLSVLGLAYLVYEMLTRECGCLHYSQSLWTGAFFWDSISPVRYQMGSCNSSSPSIWRKLRIWHSLFDV